MTTAETTMSFLDELSWRGLLHQATADDALAKHLATPGRVGYCGFDPTADSLTIGNLVPIMMLRHWQRAGHTPIVIMGGGTGLIGDPSGKDEERRLLTPDAVEANIAQQRTIFERVLDFDPDASNRAVVLNNYDWLKSIGYIEMLRDVGKHFSIGAMLQRDAVKNRLEQRDHGMSYTEFSYMILQAYDFLRLYESHGCTVQMAGSDQFGNIVSGIDLIRRRHGSDRGEDEHLAFGVTAPLVTRADGGKFGKSETGAVWLSANRTSPYAFYQFWINADDADVVRYLKLFTFLSADDINDLADQHAAAPHERTAHRALARSVTAMMHGEAELHRVEAAAQTLFSGNVRDLAPDMLDQVFAEVPHSTHDKAGLEGDGASLVDVLAETSLAGSKREAREFLKNGAIAVNGEKVEPDRTLTTADLLGGETILLKRGKKHWHATKWR